MDAAGNLYGTTYFGGNTGNGTVFKLAADGTETVLYSFQDGDADGGNPQAGLIMDGAGNLFGTTRFGGTHVAVYHGVVFELAADGTETVLYTFDPQPERADGAQPRAGLVMDAAGNLYGTTTVAGGPANGGVVFKLTP